MLLRLCVVWTLFGVSSVLSSSSVDRAFDVEAAAGHVRRAHERVAATMRGGKGGKVAENRGGEGVLNGGKCEWDAAQGKCGASDGAIAEILGSSENPSAKFLTKTATCQAAKDADACKAIDDCSWVSKPHIKECIYLDLFAGQEESPCGKDAPLLLSLFESDMTCRTAPNQDSCLANIFCYWEESESECHVDFLYVFLGFTTKDYGEITEQKIGELILPFTAEFPIQQEGFDWDTVLDWKVPQTSCPQDASEAGCKFTDLVLSYLMPATFYCQLKYGSFFQFPQCFQDPVCQFDLGKFSCGPSDETSTMAIAKSYQDAASLVEHLVDRDFLVKEGECLAHAKSQDCAGDCLWVDSLKSCGYKDSAIYTSMLNPEEGGDDPLCEFLNTSIESDCLDRESQGTCQASLNCHYGSEEECTPTMAYAITKLGEKDADLKAAYGRVQEECSGYTTSEECGSGA